MTKGRAARGFPLAALLLFTACSGPSSAMRRTVNQAIASHQYGKAEMLLNLRKETAYGRKNMVLYYLDLGAILHHAGKYQESDQSFERAETRMNELYTKSVTKAGGMLLLNDNTIDYAGESFERSLLNIMRALNYVFLGNTQEAIVEARKVELFLDGLNRAGGSKNVYKDDAFARYLDHMLYEDLGQSDDARISLEAANAAYQWYAADYQTPAPKFDLPQPAEKDSGELVFIHYNGTAPMKVSQTYQVAWGNALAIAKENQTEGGGAQFRNALRAGIAGSAITIADPQYVQDPFRISGSEVFVDGSRQGATVLMEDVSAIAFKTLRDHINVIRSRAVARATVKYVLAQAASQASAQDCDKKYGPKSDGAAFCRSLSRGLAFGLAAATEIADTRAWSTAPSQIRMARLRLAAGAHDVKINFLDGLGAVVESTEFKKVMVRSSKRTYLHYRTAT